MKQGVVERIGAAMSRAAAKLMPDPFVLAIGLTTLTPLLCLLFGKDLDAMGTQAALKKIVVDGWFAGLWGQGGLSFAFQMILVLVTGFALASSRPVRALMNLLATLPRSAAQASGLVALVACASGYLHWGLGAVTGAMLAREIGRAWAEKDKPLHYPLLGAAAYSGLLVWHGGLSGSAPLKIAEPGHFLEQVTGVIPVQQTLFGAMNLIIILAMTLVTVGLYMWLTPSDPAHMKPYQAPQAPTPAPHDAAQAPKTSSSLGEALNTSFAVPLALASMGLAYLLYAMSQQGMGALNLNTVNLAFLSLGLLLHGKIKSYLEAAAEGARGTVGIILQFPLYFGLLGMLKVSGLITVMSQAFLDASTPDTLPLLTYLSAGAVNLLVPSGGGQWAVQGPIIMEAARTMGADPGKVVIALAHGDAWTNMLQPFWALPLLGIMGLEAKDIAGYTALLFLVAGPITLALLWFL